MPDLKFLPSVSAAVAALVATHVSAGEIESASAVPDKPAFDIQSASIEREDNTLRFRIEVSANAGEEQPEAIGTLAGSEVYSYVWPTSLDPSVIGFGTGTGLLAFAVTSHPDFDDTPLFDEDGDGDATNDGRIWHSHWVVLTETDECGPSGLKVRDIEKGEDVRVPKTWPKLPLMIDSPGWHPNFTANSVEVTVPFEPWADLVDVAFDGVTSALRVNVNAHVPLLCVNAVFDVASGDLSLPGRTH
ncbi:MAG: hypothetical protein AAFY59_12505 [Pseudomonadota bacterium]